jgi:hypothetical protein
MRTIRQQATEVPMFARLTRTMTAHVADFEDVMGVDTLFMLLFLGLTLSGAA